MQYQIELVIKALFWKNVPPQTANILPQVRINNEQAGSVMDYAPLRQFWTPLFIYLLLLAVYLVILGIGLAGLASALRRHWRRVGR
jgi:hypothetical protein